MGWESDDMLRVYHDPCIVVTEDSGWFFAHMRQLL
jgi:hypothetical protein